ncbi:glycosyltransferase [Geomonas terrae]|uniref:Glycosyltransferase n=1 Tax=Geomonas terrae TaxID=2562681 RepID=A0A4S1CBA8_9BACT|nr:ATP-grasp fold amidoligase family protein [Geomonas terrae]TGU70216.1 glycosyltransferase [Geomonas terrae]
MFDIINHKMTKKVIKSTEEFGIRLKEKRLPYDNQRWKTLIDLILLPSDIYKVLTDYKNRFGVFPNLIKPSTFNECIQQSKFISRKSIYTQLADKLQVREYIENTIGKQYLCELLWFGTNIQEARKIQLPDSFVIKANNGSGTNFIVYNKSSIDWDHLDNLTQRWLSKDLSTQFAEWQYRWIKPKLLIEELLRSEDNQIPNDYKFFCFHGKVKMVQVDMDRFTNHTLTMLNRNFEVLPIHHVYPTFRGEIRKPECFELMISLAERLAKNEKFIRIDFYDLNGRPIFGEATLHPSAGREKFEPPIWDKKLGDIFLKRCGGDDLSGA